MLVGRFSQIAAGIRFLLAEVLRVSGTVAIAAGFFLTAGFLTGVGRFTFHNRSSFEYLVVPHRLELWTTQL